MNAIKFVVLCLALFMGWGIAAFASYPVGFENGIRQEPSVRYDAGSKASDGYDAPQQSYWRYDAASMHNAADTIPQFIYRTGSQTDNALTDASGVSFRDSISSSADGQQVFAPGQNIYAVDTTQLPPGSVDPDGVPAGHVSVNATADEIRAAIVPQGPENPLFEFNLNPMQNGSSYKLPK